MGSDIQLFWGKAQPAAGKGTGMHPLVAHSLDVAAVSLLLPRRLTFGLTGQNLGFLVALHEQVLQALSGAGAGVLAERCAWPLSHERPAAAGAAA